VPPTPRYTVIIDKPVQATLRRLPRDLQERLGKELLKLETNPTPARSTPLQGFKDTYRLRVGDWRIIYILENERLIITIIRIGPRGDVYRGL
jgi:mRNA interferase RelE/StbE